MKDNLIYVIKDFLIKKGYKLSGMNKSRIYATTERSSFSQLLKIPQKIYIKITPDSDDQQYVEMSIDFLKRFRFKLYLRFIIYFIFIVFTFIASNYVSKGLNAIVLIPCIIIILVAAELGFRVVYRSTSTMIFVEEMKKISLKQGIILNDIKITDKTDFDKIIIGIAFVLLTAGVTVDHLSASHPFSISSFFVILLPFLFLIISLFGILFLSFESKRLIFTTYIFKPIFCLFLFILFPYACYPISLYIEKYPNPTLGIFCYLLFFVATVTIMYFIWRGHSMPVLKKEVEQEIENFRNASPKSPYFLDFIAPKYDILIKIFILMFWFVVVFVNFIGLYSSFCILEKLFWGSNYFFASNVMSLFYDGTEKFLFSLFPFLPRLSLYAMHSFLIGGYAAFIFVLIISVIIKNIIESKGTYVRLRKSIGEYKEEQKSIIKIITPICEYFNISIPQIIIIDSDSINAQAKFMIYPYCKTAITISKGAIDKLNKSELNALIAHEASHLANGIKMQKFLYVMSDITFCGSAFLNILQNSFSLELKADDDALEWLKNNNISYKYIISLLEKKNIDQAMSYIFINGLSFQGMHASKKNIIDEYYNKTFLQRRKIDIKIFTQIYFNQSIISYIHPSNEFRINRINKIAKKD